MLGLTMIPMDETANRTLLRRCPEPLRAGLEAVLLRFGLLSLARQVALISGALDGETAEPLPLFRPATFKRAIGDAKLTVLSRSADLAREDGFLGYDEWRYDPETLRLSFMYPDGLTRTCKAYDVIGYLDDQDDMMWGWANRRQSAKAKSDMIVLRRRGIAEGNLFFTTPQIAGGGKDLIFHLAAIAARWMGLPYVIQVRESDTYLHFFAAEYPETEPAT